MFLSCFILILFLDQLDVDLKECFLSNGIYGVPGGGWPNRTVMVYRLKTNKKWGDCKVIRNNPANHAEIIFIDEVRNSITEKHTKIKIKMFISYSPCDECAMQLIHWIKKLREKKTKFSIAIKFSNFYLKHRDGLRSLHKFDKTLGVFNTEVWTEFFKLIHKNLNKFQELINQRADREKEDARILDGIISLKRI